MAPLKTKGDLAELKVACDLVERGYRVAIPFGEDCDFDLCGVDAGKTPAPDPGQTLDCNERLDIRSLLLAFTHKWQGQEDQGLHGRDDRHLGRIRADHGSVLLPTCV